MLFVKLNDFFQIVIAPVLIYPSVEHFFLHETAVQQSTLKILTCPKFVCFLDVRLRSLRILAVQLTGADRVVRKIRPQLRKALLWLSAKLRQPLQNQFPQSAVKDFCLAHDSRLQIQLLPCNAVQLLRQSVPAEKMGDQPQPGGVALTVHISPLLAFVRDIPCYVTADNLAAFPNLLLAPYPFFRHVCQLMIFRKALKNRQLVAL